MPSDTPSSGNEPSDDPRGVLIATLGAEPQVVTLALDALKARAVAIERVMVVHTLDTREPIRASLRALQEVFLARAEYGANVMYVPYSLGGPKGALEDVTTREQIDVAFQSLYTLIRQMKHAGWRIHLCVAGGRKTLGFTALSVAQILLDRYDSVWHVVSDPELVTSRAFHAASAGQVTLVPVLVRAWEQGQGDSSIRLHRFLQHTLTAAEREVALLLAREGLPNEAIAQRLGKSARTVENQLSRVYIKAEREFDLPGRVDRVILLSLIGGNPYGE